MDPDQTSLAWIAARKRHQLSHAHVQMARELGMNPDKLGKLDNHRQEAWKLPLPLFIEELYEKRFGKTRPDLVVTVEERAKSFRKGKEEKRAAKQLAREAARDALVPAAPYATAQAPRSTIDDRPEVRELLTKLKSSLGPLRSLLSKHTSERAYEDPVYRFFHQSFKVYELQSSTLEIVAALQALAPERTLNASFLQIVREGTGQRFEPDDNERWTQVTRPIVEAFFHSRFFLEQAVKYGERLKLKAPPQLLPSGWAALLTLYGLR